MAGAESSRGVETADRTMKEVYRAWWSKEERVIWRCLRELIQKTDRDNFQEAVLVSSRCGTARSWRLDHSPVLQVLLSMLSDIRGQLQPRYHWTISQGIRKMVLLVQFVSFFEVKSYFVAQAALNPTIQPRQGLDSQQSSCLGHSGPRNTGMHHQS